jgi:hypothetical protein
MSHPVFEINKEGESLDIQLGSMIFDKRSLYLGASSIAKDIVAEGKQCVKILKTFLILSLALLT